MIQKQKKILMVAAENDALPNAKVGGIGDVIRDIPPALAGIGCTVHVVVPSHGFLHAQHNAEKKAHFPVIFGGGLMDVALYYLGAEATKSGATVDGVHQWVIHHSAMAPGGAESVYNNDGSSRPFATDATKYAFFCAAVGQAVLQMEFGELDVLHLHDWHAAFLAILRSYDKHYKKLLDIPTVYTIHNLALQGVRPLRGDPSSMEQWYPTLKYDQSVICDPMVTHCVNPMRAGIELCDRVHAVSPSYAEEITQPTDVQNLVYGGEGLECNLKTAAKQQRLKGILNGCEYPDKTRYSRLSKVRLVGLIKATLVQWASKSTLLSSAHWVAGYRLSQWAARKQKGTLITSVGRITDQKVKLFHQSITGDGKHQSVLDSLLSQIGPDCLFVLLGSGDATLEAFMLEVSGRHENFLFLSGYSEALAEALYSSGDLFLMPSSYEPCGISQMLAMRAGQPCVVHGVGGLKDTVCHGETGFVFDGENGQKQGESFIATTLAALAMAKDQPDHFKKISKAAAGARFEWGRVAKQYLEYLY